MKFIRILNIVALAALFFLWLLLIFTRESYMGSGLTIAKNIDSSGYYFSSQNPFTFYFNGNLHGFFSDEINNDTSISKIWELNIDSNIVKYYPIPNGNIEKIEAITLSPDSQLVIVGSSKDSLFSVLIFDTIIQNDFRFTAPAPFLGIGFPKGKKELVFGRKGNVLGHIFTLTDTVEMRTYDLPNFYNRICEINQVFVEDDIWKFLTQTNFYRRNDVWIILDTSKKSNYLVWDERAVYPAYPGVLNLNPDSALQLMDYTLSNKVLNLPLKDSILQFQHGKFHFIKPIPQKAVFTASLMTTPDTGVWKITSLDTAFNTNGKIILSAYLGGVECNIPYMVDSTFQILMPESEAKQLFFNHGEVPISISAIGKNRYLLLGSKLSYAILDENGVSLNRQNFISTLHFSILKIYPEEKSVLEVKLPEIKALQYFFLLYGLFPMWIISLIANWLIKVLRKKPRFSVREMNLPLAIRLLPGTIFYLIIYGISIIYLLRDFSLI